MKEIIELGFKQKLKEIDRHFTNLLKENLKLMEETTVTEEILDEMIAELCLVSNLVKEYNKLKTEYIEKY